MSKFPQLAANGEVEWIEQNLDGGFELLGAVLRDLNGRLEKVESADRAADPEIGVVAVEVPLYAKVDDREIEVGTVALDIPVHRSGLA